MSNVSIDLSPVVNRLDNVAQLAEHVSKQVEAVSHQHQDTRNALERLIADFQSFVAADTLAKEIQRAETRVITVRQELDKKYGHHDIVRRRTTGILQATDVALVRQETMQVAGEQIMLDAPRYWLAPAMVALTAWIRDDAALTRRAVTEAMRRDDYKTTLFMALVCRRFGRHGAVDQWLNRYFQQQNPFALDREVMTLLDAMANGVFGAGASGHCASVLKQWLAAQAQQPVFATEQRQRWIQAMIALTPAGDFTAYPTLTRHAGNWRALDSSLAAARLNQVLAQHFARIIDQEVVLPERLVDAVDDILQSLVTNFDDDELVLRREERSLQLVIEKAGDVAAARASAVNEQRAFDEKISFAQLLTNAAMFPAQVNATIATQKFALGMSREWVTSAYGDVVAQTRAAVPAGVPFEVHNWKATSAYGEDEKALISAFDGEMKKRLADLLAVIKDSPKALIIASLVGAAGFFIYKPLALIAAVIGLYAWWTNHSANETRRKAIQKQHAQQVAEGKKIIVALCAECVDFKRRLASEDAKSAEVTAILGRISPEAALFLRADSGRAML
jgi:hypothetical protein